MIFQVSPLFDFGRPSFNYSILVSKFQLLNFVSQISIV